MTTCLVIRNATRWADVRSIERISCLLTFCYFTQGEMLSLTVAKVKRKFQSCGLGLWEERRNP